MILKRLTVCSVLTLAFAGAASAANSTASAALFLPADGTTKGSYVYGTGSSADNAQRWYVSTLRGGRSYQITVTPDNTISTNAFFLDVLTFATDGTSPLPGTRTDISQQYPENYNFGAPLSTFAGSYKYTYIPAAANNVSERIFIRVWDCCAYLTAGQYTYFRVSIVETTQLAPWFFTDSNYEAFTQIQNTGSSTVTGTLTHYAFVANTGGATTTCGTPVNFTIPPFSSTFIQAKATAGCTGGGGAKITHRGSAGSIRANVTSVNATGVGLSHSFNVTFTPQGQPYTFAGDGN